MKIRKKEKMKKRLILSIVIVVGVLLGLAYYTIADAKQTGNDYTSQPTCQAHPNQKLAWTLDATWLSTNNTGDWKTDNWFYMMKPYQPVYVLNSDYRSDYYFVCFQFDPEWTPIYGWAKMDTILLNSDVK